MLRKQRIAAESTEGREARLQRARSAQEQKIAAESTKEREARLQHLRDAWQRRVTSSIRIDYCILVFYHFACAVKYIAVR